MVRARIVFCALAAAMLGSTSAQAAGLFQIHLDMGPELSANPGALAAFERAAAEWEAQISSPIRINISAELGTFTDPNIIGSTDLGAAPLNLDYTTVRARMMARAGRPGNEILSSLPDSEHLRAIVPTGATFDNTTVGITRANQKALGLIDNPLTDTVADGNIKFNKAFTFDYDSRDGVDANKVDFQTAAAHEIGHVLGFLSDVDDYDTLGLISDNATTLDLFRFNQIIKPATPEEFRILPRELRPGEESFTTDTEHEYPMSTGANQGDGRQASHWKDDFYFDGTKFVFGPTIGIMDPTLNDGVSEQVGEADLRAMELIGYDTPEPGGITILGLGTMGMLARRRANPVR